MEAIGLMPSSIDKPGGKKTDEKTADHAIEDGLLMQTTDALLATDFRVSWFGRHPPTGGKVAAIFGDTGNGDDDENGGVTGLLEPVTLDSKSNRDKYHCLVCAVQVWGKPDLKLICSGDDCDGMAFELATSQEK